MRGVLLAVYCIVTPAHIYFYPKYLVVFTTKSVLDIDHYIQREELLVLIVSEYIFSFAYNDLFHPLFSFEYLLVIDLLIYSIRSLLL
jgi:hypothetical protein